MASAERRTAKPRTPLELTDPTVLHCVADKLSVEDVKALSLTSRACREHTMERRLKKAKLVGEDGARSSVLNVVTGAPLAPLRVRAWVQKLVLYDMVCSLRPASWPNLKSVVLKWSTPNYCLNPPRQAALGFQEAVVEARLPHLEEVVMERQADPLRAIETAEASWPSLASLTTDKSEVSDFAVEALMEGCFPSLSSLSLSQNSQFTSRAVLALTKNSFVTNVRHLHLEGNRLCDAAAAALSEVRWPFLSTLALNSNNIGPEGAKALARGDWPSLSFFSLRENRIGPDGAEGLAQGTWQSLSSLNLDANRIGVEGASGLAQGTWPSLSILDLSWNGITYEGVQGLLRGDWPSLSCLRTRGNSISREGVQALQARGLME